MIVFWSLTSMGLLMSMQYKCQREFDKPYAMSLAERERRLDEESRALDLEIAGLLQEHRRLVERGG
jgi:hypothetical protein